MTRSPTPLEEDTQMTSKTPPVASTARRFKMALAVAGLIALSAWAIGWWSGRNSATAVSAQEAATLVGAADHAARIDPGQRPLSGTYSYTGRGWDSFSFGGGSEHQFPDEMNVVVEFDEPGCGWTAHIVFIKEHVEKRAFCTSTTGVKDIGFSRTTRTLGREQTSEYECTGNAWRFAAGVDVGETWRYSCTERRGGVVRYIGTRLPDVSMKVGEERQALRHVQLRGTQRGKHVGKEESEYWLLETGLPARFMSTRYLRVNTPMGDMTSRESYDYSLTSPTPEVT